MAEEKWSRRESNPRPLECHASHGVSWPSASVRECPSIGLFRTRREDSRERSRPVAQPHFSHTMLRPHSSPRDLAWSVIAVQTANPSSLRLPENWWADARMPCRASSLGLLTIRRHRRTMSWDDSACQSVLQDRAGRRVFLQELQRSDDVAVRAAHREPLKARDLRHANERSLSTTWAGFSARRHIGSSHLRMGTGVFFWYRTMTYSKGAPG
jgi:hypothetical protein